MMGKKGISTLHLLTLFSLYLYSLQFSLSLLPAPPLRRLQSALQSLREDLGSIVTQTKKLASCERKVRSCESKLSELREDIDVETVIGKLKEESLDIRKKLLQLAPLLVERLKQLEAKSRELDLKLMDLGVVRCEIDRIQAPVRDLEEFIATLREKMVEVKALHSQVKKEKKKLTAEAQKKAPAEEYGEQFEGIKAETVAEIDDEITDLTARKDAMNVDGDITERYHSLKKDVSRRTGRGVEGMEGSGGVWRVEGYVFNPSSLPSPLPISAPYSHYIYIFMQHTHLPPLQLHLHLLSDRRTSREEASDGE